MPSLITLPRRAAGVALRLLRPRVRHSLLFSMPLADSSQQSSVSGYEFRPLTAADVDGSPVFDHPGRRARHRGNLEQGHQLWGYVATNGDVACYLWLTLPPTPASWCGPARLRPAPGHAYIWDCRTAEAHKRRGLYRSGLHLLTEEARRQGASTAMIDCTVDNVASRRAIEQAGFRLCGRFSALLWGRRAILVSRLFRNRLIVARSGTVVVLPQDPSEDSPAN